MKALHVVGQLEFGGVSTWLRTLLSALHPGTMRIDICCNYRGGAGRLAQEFRNLGCQIHYIPLGINPYSYMRRFREILRTESYDVVHDHRSFLGGATLKAAYMEEVPVRILFHHTPNDDRRAGGLKRLYERLLRHWALSHCSEVWACSETAMSAHYGNGWQNSNRLRVIHSAVIPGQPKPDARRRLRNEFGIPKDASVIGFVGRVTPAKNPLMVVRVFSKLARVLPEARLLLVGDGPLLPEIRDFADSDPAKGRMFFTGFRPDIADLLQVFDVLFQPSFFEGLPLTTLEALHAGLPVVGSTAPGLLAALPPVQQGLCRAPEDLEGYVSILSSLLAKPIRREVPCEFLARFSPSVFAEKVVAGYREELGRSAVKASV